MKLHNGISLFNKQSSKAHKIRKNDILEKNCNFSVPFIENELNKKKQDNIYPKENSKEKVTLLKSFYTKNDKSKSKSKSNSNSKEYIRRNRLNNHFIPKMVKIVNQKVKVIVIVKNIKEEIDLIINLIIYIIIILI